MLRVCYGGNGILQERKFAPDAEPDEGEAPLKRQRTEAGCEFQPRSRRGQPGAHTGGKVALRESWSGKKVKRRLSTPSPGRKRKRPAPEARRRSEGRSGRERSAAKRWPGWVGAYGTEAPGHARMRRRRVRREARAASLSGRDPDWRGRCRENRIVKGERFEVVRGAAGRRSRARGLISG